MRPKFVSDTLSGEITPIRRYLETVQMRQQKNSALQFIPFCQGDVFLVPHQANGAPVAQFLNYEHGRPYSPALGKEWFRHDYANFINRVFRVQLNWEQVVATHGGEHAATLTLAVLSGRVITDEGILAKGVWYCFAPGYPGNITAAKNAGVQLRWISRFPKDDWACTPTVLSNLKEHVTNDRQNGLFPIGVIVTTPGNPEGKVWTKQEIKSILAFVKKEDMYAAFDIPYALFAPDQFAHPLISSNWDDDERIILWDSFSKLGHACGHRAGAAYFPEHLIPYVKEYAGLGPSQFSQRAYLTILRDQNIDRHVKLLRETYAPIIQVATKMLKSVKDIQVPKIDEGNVTPYLLVNDLGIAQKGDAAQFHDFLATEFEYKNIVTLGAPWLGAIGVPDYNGLIRFALIHDVSTTEKGLEAYLKGREEWLKR